MSITLTDLAIRTLRKMQVLGQDQTPSPGDLQLAKDKVRAAHAMLRVKGLLRWTLSDIPDFAEEPYAMLAAMLAASDFQVAIRQEWALGLSLIEEGINMPSTGTTPTEYF